jgi:uncharacterized membrane protein
LDHWFIAPLAFVGLLISYYIYYSKSKKHKLVCLTGDDCNLVVRSRYASVFGIPNEVIGLAYYAGMLAFSGLQFLVQLEPAYLIQFGAILVSGIAASVSVVLTVMLFGMLKKFCEYCVAANTINIIIFLLILL